MAAIYEDVEALLDKAVRLFQEKFNEQPTVAACAPGRVNLIGDHVDYNGGFVLPMALPMVTVAVARTNELKMCRLFTDMTIRNQGESNYIEFDSPTTSTPLCPGVPKWANYVKGVIACFHGEVNSFDCVLVSSVPVGAGLSSSAAVEVATYTLLEELMNNPCDSFNNKALACQKAEHTFAGVPCGIMDQYISTVGKEGHALLLDCKSITGTMIPFQDDDICVLIIDSGVKHDLSGSEYPKRRSQCEQVAKALNKEFLRDVTRNELEERKDDLDPEAYRRALHVINEIEYTQKFADLVQRKLYAEAGKCMFQSHESLSTLYNVSCPELDLIVELASKEKGVYGARMTGGGFGGCVVSLVQKIHVEAVIQSISNQCHSNNVKPNFYICIPSNGARPLKLKAN